MSDYLITDFLKNNSEKIITQEIQDLINKVTEEGGGKVIFPAANYLTGSLELKDNVELYLSAGAVLKFSDQPKDYPPVKSRWEGVEQEVYAPCFYAKEANNIAITGLGTIDGNGKLWWKRFRNKSNELKYPRPTTIGFDGCSKVTLRDITIINSPSWTVNPIKCDDIIIDSLHINNPKDSPNTDGIDPESCRNVRICNCSIDVGDDCIAIKSGKESIICKTPSENITISNCLMLHGHGGIVFGSEMSGGIRNVTISNCIFDGTDRGLRFKSRRGRGGIVEDIRVMNIVMQQVICPFVINSDYSSSSTKKEAALAQSNLKNLFPKFRRLYFSNISARNVVAAAGYICGLEDEWIQDISFDNISISMADNPEATLPAMGRNVEPMKKKGFLLNYVKKVSFRALTMNGIEGPIFLEGYVEKQKYLD